MIFNFTLPGQGYPFSNINVSSLNIGEAVYIISTSKDKKMVFDPQFFFLCLGKIKQHLQNFK
ncbi:hypothetical protein CDV26_00695 [Francisella halioticida]|uniref:SH3b1 domain-containing protein n=1 Tax=Francisella halioticida TaxID=549298 RepID=A0ABM6M271_9GAMM|nr:hypothetical protein CDV26_00695 [Francisella halioticida]